VRKADLKPFSQDESDELQGKFNEHNLKRVRKQKPTIDIDNWRWCAQVVVIEVPTASDRRRFTRKFGRALDLNCANKSEYQASLPTFKRVTGLVRGVTSQLAIRRLQRLVDGQTTNKGIEGTYRCEDIWPTDGGGILHMSIDCAAEEALAALDWTLRLGSAGGVKFKLAEIKARGARGQSS